MDLEYMKMQILETGLLILAAYFGGVIARKMKIGEVIGQITGGILVGPHFLELVHRFLESHPVLSNYTVFKPIYHFYRTNFEEYAEVLEGYHFFVFLFLGLIAFSIGEELHTERLKKVGPKATFICLLQAFLTWVLLSAGFYFLFDFPFIYAALVGSIGIATAPALTFILMAKLNIEGKLRNILANIVVLDDVIEVIFFSITLGIAMQLERSGHLSVVHLTKEVGLELFWALFIGFMIYLVLRFFIKERPPVEEEENSEGFISLIISDHPTPSVEILFIIMGIISVGVAVAINFDLPFLITAVTAGFLISNFHSSALFDSLKIGGIMPVFNLLFFAVIGASVRIESFSGETFIFVLGYFVLRATGKLAGNWIGSKLSHQDPKITASLPFLMMPQAGMAAVETIMVAKMLPGKEGMMIFNTIIPALVLFELIGAFLSEKTLIKWKNWTTGEREVLEAKSFESADLDFQELIGGRVYELIARSKEDALFEMVKTLHREELIGDTASILDAVREREQLSSTAVGDGVALPHCRSEAVENVKVVCGALSEPVSWDGAQSQTVDLIFFIVSPKNDPDQHLKALRTITLELQKGNVQKKIRAALNEKGSEEYVRFSEADSDNS